MSAPTPPPYPYPNRPQAVNVAYVSAHARARLVIGLMIAFIVASFVSLGSEIFEINHYSRIVAGEGVTETDELFYGLIVIGVGLLYLLVYIPTAVLFLMWIYRVYKNMPALGAQRLEYTPGWVVGYFFIPIVNLFYPYRAVREIWRKSDPDVYDPEHYSVAPKSMPFFIGLWWLVWVVSNILDRVVFRLSISEEDPARLLWITKLGMVSGVVNIASAVLAIMVVREIDERQEARARRFQSQQAPPPPPVFNQGGASILTPPA